MHPVYPAHISMTVLITGESLQLQKNNSGIIECHRSFQEHAASISFKNMEVSFLKNIASYDTGNLLTLRQYWTLLSKSYSAILLLLGVILLTFMMKRCRFQHKLRFTIRLWLRRTNVLMLIKRKSEGRKTGNHSDYAVLRTSYDCKKIHDNKKQHWLRYHMTP